MVFETTVTKVGVETSDANPEERRYYVSNIVGIPSRDPSLSRKASKSADEYFIAAVSGPLKAKGIEHKYYDDAIHINNSVVYRLDTKQEVEELEKKTIEELKEQNANLFTFTWIYGDSTKGLETSLPTLVRHAPEQPLYGMTVTKPVIVKPKAPVKKNH